MHNNKRKGRVCRRARISKLQVVLDQLKISVHTHTAKYLEKAYISKMLKKSSSFRFDVQIFVVMSDALTDKSYVVFIFI